MAEEVDLRLLLQNQARLEERIEALAESQSTTFATIMTRLDQLLLGQDLLRLQIQKPKKQEKAYDQPTRESSLNREVTALDKFAIPTTLPGETLERRRPASAQPLTPAGKGTHGDAAVADRFQVLSTATIPTQNKRNARRFSRDSNKSIRSKENGDISSFAPAPSMGFPPPAMGQMRPPGLQIEDAEKHDIRQDDSFRKGSPKSDMMNGTSGKMFLATSSTSVQVCNPHEESFMSNEDKGDGRKQAFGGFTSSQFLRRRSSIQSNRALVQSSEFVRHRSVDLWLNGVPDGESSMKESDVGSYHSEDEEDDDMEVDLYTKHQYISSYSLAKQTFNLIWLLVCFLETAGLFIVIAAKTWGDDVPDFFWLFYIFSSVFFALSIYVESKTLYYNDSLSFSEELSAAEVHTRYFKTWFIFDVILMLPFAIFGLYFSPVAFRALALVRLLRVIKVPHLLSWQNPLEDVPPFIFYQKIGFGIFFSGHVCACGALLLFNHYEPKSLIALAGDEDDILNKYTASLYWVIMTISTVGYGDIFPTEFVTRLYAMFVGVFTMFVNGFLISALIQPALKDNALKEIIHLKSNKMSTIMNMHSIPEKLKNQVISVYPLVLEAMTQNNVDELNELPPFLRRQIRNYIVVSMLKHVHLLKNAHPKLCRLLSKKMMHIIPPPNTYLFRKGDVGTCMYLLISGVVEVLQEDEKGNMHTQATLKDGSWFGEMSLFKDTIRAASIRTMTSCNLYQLDKTVFNAAVAKFPEFLQAVKQGKGYGVDAHELQVNGGTSNKVLHNMLSAFGMRRAMDIPDPGSMSNVDIDKNLPRTRWHKAIQSIAKETKSKPNPSHIVTDVASSPKMGNCLEESKLSLRRFSEDASKTSEDGKSRADSEPDGAEPEPPDELPGSPSRATRIVSDPLNPNPMVQIDTDL